MLFFNFNTVLLLEEESFNTVLLLEDSKQNKWLNKQNIWLNPFLFFVFFFEGCTLKL